MRAIETAVPAIAPRTADLRPRAGPIPRALPPPNLDAPSKATTLPGRASLLATGTTLTDRVVAAQGGLELALFACRSPLPLSRESRSVAKVRIPLYANAEARR